MRAEKFYPAGLLIPALMLFCSCGPADDQKQNDPLSEDSFSVDTRTPDPITPVVNETPIPYKLSHEDSTRVADSVAVNRNAVRDFD